MASANLSLKEKQRSFIQLNNEEMHTFVDALPQKNKNALDHLISNIATSKDSLISIAKSNDGDILLLIQGLDFPTFPAEWIQPFETLLQKNRESYFYKWSKFDSIESNRDQLTTTIKSILEKNPDRKLVIFGYSAGGVLTTLAADSLIETPFSKRIEFHTIASPIFGYKAPAIAVFGTPFAGKSSIQIGTGKYEKATHMKIPHCHHWITINCEMDQHSCDKEGLNPQTGSSSSATSLPCGAENITSYDNESHISVLNRAFTEIIK